MQGYQMITELQSRLAVHVFAGKHKLLSKLAMHTWMRQERKHIQETLHGKFMVGAQGGPGEALPEGWWVCRVGWELSPRDGGFEGRAWELFSRAVPATDRFLGPPRGLFARPEFSQGHFMCNRSLAVSTTSTGRLVVWSMCHHTQLCAIHHRPASEHGSREDCVIVGEFQIEWGQNAAMLCLVPTWDKVTTTRLNFTTERNLESTRGALSLA